SDQHKHTDYEQADEVLSEARFFKGQCSAKRKSRTNDAEQSDGCEKRRNRAGARLSSRSDIEAAPIAITQSLQELRAAICAVHIKLLSPTLDHHRMISEPEVNGLSDTNKETDYCPKKFNRF